MQQEQKQKQDVVTGTQSMVLVKNMLRLSLSSVCYQVRDKNLALITCTA